jgi:peptide/nickel transport system ATP-binding protein
VRPLFATPQHPYTQGLLACLPGKAHGAGQTRPKRLFAIRGQVSSPLSPPPGCAFEPRCDHAQALCTQAMPALVDASEGRQARCVRVPAAVAANAA